VLSEPEGEMSQRDLLGDTLYKIFAARKRQREERRERRTDDA
jgi:hypothetical protein